MPRLWSLIPNLCLGATRKIRDFDLRLGGCEICAWEIYFSNFWKIMKEKYLSDPQPDSTIQPKARGYSIWSMSTSRTIYDHDFEAWAPHSLGATRSTWRTTRCIWGKPQETFWLFEVLEDDQPSTRCLQDSTTKSSGACQIRGSGTAYRHRMF